MSTEANMASTDFSGFTSYKQLVIELTNDLKQLRAFSEKMKLDGNIQSIDDVLKRLMEDTFSVAIIGEFKRGKSTLINALMGKDVLPMDVLPTTATLNKITYGMAPYVTIEYKDGKMEEVDIGKLNDYVTKLTRESEEKAKTVKEATVHYPVNYCKNGITIIDTPGLNDDEAMTEVTMSVLPQIDAALMVVMAQSPFSESERSFLESKVITSDLGRVLFVVTGIDLLDEDDVDRVLENITNRIQDHIMKKAEKTYGADSEEYEAYIRKIGKVRIYGISAKKALKAKIKGDDAMLAQSCFPEFEAALERFLTEDRGAVMLNVPVGRIKASAIEIAKAVQIRENALLMQKDEFDLKYKEAMKEIENIRAERQNEFIKINETAQTTYEELLPAIHSFWQVLEEAAFRAVDDFPLESGDLSKENLQETQERISKAVSGAISTAGQEESERIQEKINQALGKEADRISGFEEKFGEATERIQNLFTLDMSDASLSDKYSIAAGAALNYFTLGLGSAYVGYKQAGWKGALLGGATGAAGTWLGAYGAGILLATVGLPITWPVLIVGSVVGSLIGVFGGKKAVDTFFPGKGRTGGGFGKIESVRESVKDSVKVELNKMREQDNYGQKVHSQIDEAFERLKDKIKTETDRIMSDTQNQLTQLKIERATGELTGKKEKEEMLEMLNRINSICQNADKTGKQLTAILGRGLSDDN